MLFKYKSYYDIFIYPPQMDLELILSKVCKVSGLNIEALKTKSRKRELVEARQAFFIIAANLTNKSLFKIGAMVNRDHATVIHAKDNAHIPEIKQIIAKTNLL